MNDYKSSVEKKLKQQGFSEEEIGRKINKIIDPNYMEETKVVDEVNVPVVTPDEDIEKIIDSDEVEEDEVEETPVVVDTSEEEE